MKIKKIYEDLQYVDDKFPIDLVIIFSDLNTKLGMERGQSNHMLHEETNRNSEMPCEFAFANNTIIMMSAEFQYKQIYKAILIPPDQNTINQRDHILVNAKKKKKFKI
jgi:hypothetical protein